MLFHRFCLFLQKRKTMKIINLSEITSTNTYLLDNADKFSAEEYTVAVADYQSNGMGMSGNTWESENGKNLLFSILIHPDWLDPGIEYLVSMAEALALKDAIAEQVEAAGMSPDDVTIKWPNDIYWKDKKISGTRIDGNIKGYKLVDMVIGTGINVNQREFHSDAPNPVSLWQITGREHSVEELLNRVMERFIHYYNIAREEWEDGYDCGTIMDEYHESMYRREGVYRFEDEYGEFEASMYSVHPNGLLLLERTDGTISEYDFKEVKFII